MPRTLFDKIWEAHLVKMLDEGPSVLYIDKHLVHEVTSPQAFAGLQKRNIGVARGKSTMVTVDHNVPTLNQHLPIKDAVSRKQVETLEENCKKFELEFYGLGHPYQGIVHVIAPELGITLPGMTLVCGDSHTSTHGAFGCIAFGIGTSEVEQVLATQCLLQSKPGQMRIVVDGILKNGVSAKDVILHLIAHLGSGGARGHFIEFAGSTIRAMSMEERMTVCNMSIEMGAKGGLIAPDEVTFVYCADKTFSPKNEKWQEALTWWKTLFTEDDAQFEKEYVFNADDISPMITYGTDPGMGITINGNIPVEGGDSFKRALNYMDLTIGEKMEGKKIDWVFIGSCTNSRIEDLRQVAGFVKGKKKADWVKALIVPGSRQVLTQARAEGIDKILQEAGFILREPGCSACLAMNDDKIPEGDYCVSTSNRNFEGRQGPGARTFLASPLTAAAAAIYGKITDVRKFLN